MSEITLREVQRRVDQWIQTVGVRYFSELTNMSQLMEEVGELARIMSRRFGDQSFKPGEQPTDLSDELADVLFVLVCIANQTGVDLESAFAQTMHKKNARDAQRHQSNAKLTS
jgi:NTP pyrophosphatase (non-canonical NTP hydrolase)